MSILPQFIRDLGHNLTGLFNIIHRVWEKVLDVKEKTLHLFDNIQHLVDDVETVVRDFQNFSVDPKWNSRVISAPRVLENVHTLMEVPERIIGDVKDLVELLKEKIEPMEVNTEDIESIEKLPGKLVKGGEKILGWLTLVVDSLLAIENALADLQDIASALRDVLENLSGLDGLFLPQSSTKKTVDITYRKRNG